jgi:hypothetical protein
MVFYERDSQLPVIMERKNIAGNTKQWIIQKTISTRFYNIFNVEVSYIQRLFFTLPGLSLYDDSLGYSGFNYNSLH